MTVEKGFACLQNDSLYPYLETMQAKVEWRPVVGETPALSLKLTLVEPESTYLGKVRKFEFSIDRLVFRPLNEPPLDEKLHRSLSGCVPPALNPLGSHALRRLNVHFYSLVNAPDLEDIAQRQINGACEIWCAKGGLTLTPTSAVDVISIPPTISAFYPNGEVAFSQCGSIRSDMGATDANRVEIILVNKLVNLKSGGGGLTAFCGTQDALVLLELGEARRNDYLLAHELGHVLGLRHPGPLALFQCQNYREGSYCSLMVPGRPNSARNTANNIGVTEMAAYPLTPPVLETPGGLVDWHADGEEHFFQAVRDFPYDDGTIVSVPHPTPMADWWTYSDVWNARQPLLATYDDAIISTQFYADGTTAVFGPDYSPVHQNPTTVPGQNNYMCVRLHTFEPLLSNVNVYLFLAVPGAATEPIRLINGGAPLQFGVANGKLRSPACRGRSLYHGRCRAVCRRMCACLLSRPQAASRSLSKPQRSWRTLAISTSTI